MNIPDTLYLTFEDGLHVGVFRTAEGAEALNEMRRKKRGVNPVTIRYVRAPMGRSTVKIPGEQDGQKEKETR